ncbi:PEX5-related protein isoform X1 [Entelurus aequoreus]|uniref:PEX5-related protein isoform X1 n=1 Tax=Entelurus aequoreus TaxID=161455 RepID=UPI002B1E3BD6|nr:PEX5-related protein isoform X1 [Entelurus aequoreus]
MYQGQGKGQRIAAMVLMERPAKKMSAEGAPFLARTTKLVAEHQESRPLLSPSIDDFLSESCHDAASMCPQASNASVVNLVDLSEGGGGNNTRSLMRRTQSSESEQTEAIRMEADRLLPGPGMPAKTSADSVSDTRDECNIHLDDGGRRCEARGRAGELLWCEFESHLQRDESLDDLDLESSGQDSDVSSCRRRTCSLLAKNESLEDEFVKAKAAVESDTQFWDKMQAEWEELARRNWLEEAESQKLTLPAISPVGKPYSFSANNPYKDRGGVFAEAQDKVGEGDLNDAVLLLEAALLQDPLDSEAWQVLGTTQAENENEQAAIASLQRCLEIRPDNLQALMALAVSFTNSGLPRHACGALYQWVKHNTRYTHLIQSSTPPSGTLQDVLQVFQEAVELNVDHVDPDLQTGLGVLFNLSCDFDKAVEAFSEALSVTPQDYLLWNRLGATLANGNRSEEAVEAYTRALELQPGFIRSRYNLGISCINLGAHRVAVTNLLMALNQQRRSQSCSQNQMSANIWAALRIAVSTMDQPELFQAANLKDLDQLMAAFHVVDE